LQINSGLAQRGVLAKALQHRLLGLFGDPFQAINNSISGNPAKTSPPRFHPWVRLVQFVQTGKLAPWRWLVASWRPVPGFWSTINILIGAHTMRQADALLTCNAGFYRHYFDGLTVVAPVW